MGKIKLLSEEVINKIAAGEVVERPASVVKELVENSIDAQSTRIQIEVRKGGKTFIKVIDDGCGMEEDDLLLAVERHATSKISSLEDIYSIITMGFRGEALPSIAAVSKLTITSRVEESLEGTQIKIEGGKIKSVTSIACPVGTAVTVRNLFFNTPARAKYLKTDQTEIKEIVEVVKNLALSHPQIAFSLVSNNYQVFSTPGDGKLEGALINIFGLETFESLTEIEFSSILSIPSFSPSPFKLSGYIGPPEKARTQRSSIHLFVNNRFIKSPLLTKAILQAYGSSLPSRKYPLVILHLKLNPELVDVNIHPAKREVKFADEKTIYTLVVNALEKTLQKNKFFRPQLKEVVEKSAFTKPIESREQPLFPFEEKSESKEVKSFSEFVLLKNQENPLDEEKEEKEIEDLYDKLQEARVIGQFHATYIIAEYREGFLLIDQHVAHEKYLFEKLAEAVLEKESWESQVLLFPALIELTPTQNMGIEEMFPVFRKLGLELEEFGERTYLIKTVPLIFGKVSSKEEVYEWVDFVLKGALKRDIVDLKKELISQIACRQAIKAGEKLSLLQQEKLIEKLLTLKDPTRCPHGRPIILDFSLFQIEKLFQRI